MNSEQWTLNSDGKVILRLSWYRSSMRSGNTALRYTSRIRLSGEGISDRCDTRDDR
jgi:hypothetical protein